MFSQEAFTDAVNFRLLASKVKQSAWYARLPTGLEILDRAEGDETLYRWAKEELFRDPQDFQDKLAFYMTEV